MRNIYILALITTLTLFPACGYQLAGTGTAQMPPHLKTIAIPVIGNVSQEPTINRNLVEAVRQAFIRDGRLKLVQESDNADLVLNGNISRFFVRAVGFSGSDVATEYWIYINMDVDIQDKVKNKTHLKQTLKTRWDYQPSSNVINAESARQEALLQAFRLLGNRLVSLTIDKF